MTRPRQRFATEASLLSRIDALNVKIAAECKMAEEQDATATELFQKIALVPDPEKLKGDALAEYHRSLMVATEARKNAGVLRRAQGRRQKLLLRLKETLGRFRTQPMAFLEDESEPLVRQL